MATHPNRGKKRTATASPRTTAAPPRRTAAVHRDHELDIAAMLLGVRTTFNRAIATAPNRLFTTDAAGLWDAYLDGIPSGRVRQIHNCHCCRRFIQTYGGIVSIDTSGHTKPVLWQSGMVPTFYDEAFAALFHRVKSARVTGVHQTLATTWGVPETGEWKHMSVEMPVCFQHSAPIGTPAQTAAKFRENFRIVMEAMVEYSPAVLDQALRLFEADGLVRSEKYVEPVRWLRERHDWPKGRHNATIRDNLLWRAVALAPDGFCHVKSTVVGPLLDDIKAGLSVQDLKRKHAAMMRPDVFQRPQSAPTAANIVQAEKIVEQLGISPSLERRFARFEELPLDLALWVTKPEAGQASGAGVFGHLKTKSSRSKYDSVKPLNLPVLTMTWAKFSQFAVGGYDPKRIEVRVPLMGAFFALTTAVHADAPPIMKWDDLEEVRRNPFSSYTYMNAHDRTAKWWSLEAGQFAKVNAIVNMPHMWSDQPMPHLGEMVLLIVDGCRDTHTGQGAGLFPETMKSHLHQIRATIEAYSKTAVLAGQDEASACGIGVGKESAPLDLRLQRTDDGPWDYYRIDRWD